MKFRKNRLLILPNLTERGVSALLLKMGIRIVNISKYHITINVKYFNNDMEVHFISHYHSSPLYAGIISTGSWAHDDDINWYDVYKENPWLISFIITDNTPIGKKVFSKLSELAS